MEGQHYVIENRRNKRRKTDDDGDDDDDDDDDLVYYLHLTLFMSYRDAMCTEAPYSNDLNYASTGI